MIKHEAQGFWLKQTARKSSIYREIKAVLMAMLAFLPLLKNKSAHLLSDNISEPEFSGRPFPRADRYFVQIWEIVSKYDMDLKANRLAGKLNMKPTGYRESAGGTN